MGRGVGVGRIVAVGVAVGVGLGGGVTVAVGVAVGVSVGVGVTDGVGVGEPTSEAAGASILIEATEPVLKKTMPPLAISGALSASKRKLYNVPKRIALAFWLVAKVSVLHVTEKASCVTSQGILLYPASPRVPSCAKPGCCGGA